MNWAPIIPLVGGFPLGAEEALNKKPEVVLSYSDFAFNDSCYMHYQNNIRKRDLELIQLDKNSYDISKLDMLVATCPCAGLSMLSRGSQEIKDNVNTWLYETTKLALKSGIEILVGENAPNLFTTAGEKVESFFRKIAKEFNYSLTFYQTNTLYHGIPQHRKRTFYIFWKKNETPILEWSRAERLSLKEYLETTNTNAWGADKTCKNSLSKDPFFKFAIFKFGSKENAYNTIAKNTRSALGYVRKFQLEDEFKSWADENGTTEDKRKVEYFFSKINDNKGVWDASVKCFTDVMQAVIGRNIGNGMHPSEFRPFTFREILHLMGFPDDFQISDDFPISKFNKVMSQNVPVKTGKFIIEQVKLGYENKLNTSPLRFLKQNNHNTKIVEEHETSIETFLQ